MTCSLARPAGCRCWRTAAIVLAVGFGVLEERGYRKRCRHLTLSRELKNRLGRHDCWLFTALGLWFSAHLLRLLELLEDPS